MLHISFIKSSIEKKPLYHFQPGTETYSVGSIGCNFECPFCQNWNISFADIEKFPTKKLKAEELIELAKNNLKRAEELYVSNAISKEVLENVFDVLSNNTNYITSADFANMFPNMEIDYEDGVIILQNGMYLKLVDRF